MEKILRDKFIRHKDLRNNLYNTENLELINKFENESSSNLFWGKVKDKG